MNIRLLRRQLVVLAPIAVIFALSACGLTGGDGLNDTAAQTTVPRNVTPSSVTSDEASVRRLFDQQNEAWGRGDATAYASFFTGDGDLITFDGTHVVGQAAIATYIQQAFDGPLQNTRVSAKIKDLRILATDVVIMHTEGALLFPGETEVPASRNSVQTFVATRTDVGWRVAAFHNTRIQSPS